MFLTNKLLAIAAFTSLLITNLPINNQAIETSTNQSITTNKTTKINKKRTPIKRKNTPKSPILKNNNSPLPPSTIEVNNNTQKNSPNIEPKVQILPVTETNNPSPNTDKLTPPNTTESSSQPNNIVDPEDHPDNYKPTYRSITKPNLKKSTDND